MKQDPTLLILRLLAALALLAGAGSLAHSARSLPALRRRLERKTATLAELRRIQRDQAGVTAAPARYETLSSSRAAPLAEVVRDVFPDLKPAIRQREVQPLGGGWSLRLMELTLPEAPLSRLARFLEKAQELEPPWRPRECAILASSTQPGSGAVTLVMEVIEKTK